MEHSPPQPPARRRQAPVAAVALLLCSLGCSASVTEPTGSGLPDGVGALSDFTCNPSAAAADPAPLRRLSRVQHRNTVRAVLARLYDEETVQTIMAALEPTLATHPPDQRLAHPTVHGQQLFARSDQDLSEAAARAELDIAAAIGAELTASDARIVAWAGTCAIDGTDPRACLRAMVTDLGALTHRRPLTDDEITFFAEEAYVDGETIVLEGLAELVTVLFAQPHFVFHVEGGDGVLSPYEAAARLSYHFWNTMPDAALMAAAEDGSLLTDEGWARETQRVLSDPRARSSIREFVAEWFRFGQTQRLSSGSSPTYEALRGETVIDAAMDTAVEHELVDLFEHIVASGGTFGDFFLSDVTLNTNPSLAELYGMAPSADGAPVAVPPERVGILSRAALLMPRSDISPPGPGGRTHPILRGVFVTRQILCDTIDGPPEDVDTSFPETGGSLLTTREEVELLTGQGSCVGCHQTLNAPGFALEQFDSIGRFRTEERLLGDDGEELARVALNTRVRLADGGDSLDGARELTERLYESEKPSACFARHYVRFALGRTEDVRGADSCLLREIDEALDADTPLFEVLSLVVLDPQYRTRALHGDDR